jgi:hypothetical protein
MRLTIGMMRELHALRGRRADTFEIDRLRSSPRRDGDSREHTACVSEIGQVDEVAKAIRPALELDAE